MEWNHTLTVGAAYWIYAHDIKSIKFGPEGMIGFEDDRGGAIFLPYAVLHKEEILVVPSNHSLVRLSPEVAESLRRWMKYHE